jgi:hypothetical protein|tara:strand:+ start:1407 stop:2207 length:801 start_codon:yes stop_codon:yes gene_type:complete
MAAFSSGKHALMISDRSGVAFPYREMVQEWTGMWVHTSEFEPKQPQLEPRPIVGDPQGLPHIRPSRKAFATPVVLDNNPFTTTGSNTSVTVKCKNQPWSTDDYIRFTNVAIAVGGVAKSTLELTTTLNGDITSSATSLVLADSSQFVAPGYICIELFDSDGNDVSETIYYTTNTTASNTLSGLTRGTAAPINGATPESTTAAAHSSGAKVYGSYKITRQTTTEQIASPPSTLTVSNSLTFSLKNNASSTETGGGFFCFGGPVNMRP